MQLIRCHYRTLLRGDAKALFVFGIVYLSKNIKCARGTNLCRNKIINEILHKYSAIKYNKKERETEIDFI